MASEIQHRSAGETMIRVVLIDDSALARKFLIIVKIFQRQTPVVVVASADADDAVVAQVRGIASAIILKPKVDADVEKFCRNLADAVKAAAGRIQ